MKILRIKHLFSNRTIKFEGTKTMSGQKRVAEEQIIEISSEDVSDSKKSALKEGLLGMASSSKNNIAPKKGLSIGVMTKKNALQGLVKKKETKPEEKPVSTTESKPLGGLSLVGAYSDSDEQSDD